MSISKVNVSGADYQIVGSPRYATCSTAAATAAKVATIADGSSTFVLEKGARICVSFTYANTASAATLNVASTGAKAICWQGSALVSSQYWQAGAVVDFVYDGNGWSIVGVAKDNNSTNFLPLSGGTLTGSLTVGSSSIGTNGYIEGTWLKTTKAGDKTGDFATIDGEGWIYKRTPAETLSDIGGQAKITANGFLKGDGTGTITADKPVFYVTITGTVALPTADKTPAEIYQAYEDGYAVYANTTLTGSSSSTNLKGLLPLTHIAGTAAQCTITFSSISGKEIKEVRYSPAIAKWEVPYSGVIAIKDDLPTTPSDVGAQSKITAKGLLKCNGNGVVTAAVAGMDYDTEIVYVNYTGDTPTKDNITNMTEVVEAYNAGKVIAIKAIPNKESSIAVKVPFFLTKALNNNGATYVFYFIADYVTSISDTEAISCPYCIKIQCGQTQTNNGFVYTVSDVIDYGLTKAFPAEHADTHKTGGDDPIAPSDIGAQPKITANGVLKGDGTGNVTAADETEVELVDLPQEVFWATYGTTTTAELEEAWQAGKLISMYYNNKCYSNVYRASSLMMIFYTIAGSTIYAILCNDGTWSDFGSVNLTDTKKSLSLPTASWTGSDPYTQTVTISNSTADTKVDIQPSEELYDQLVADSVGYLAIKNVDGTLTAVAKGGKPSVDLTVQVTYNNVY